MDLEEELEDVPVGRLIGIEDDLDCLGVPRMVVGGRALVVTAGVADTGGDDAVSVSQQLLGGPKQPPARRADSVFALITVFLLVTGTRHSRCGFSTGRRNSAGNNVPR